MQPRLIVEQKITAFVNKYAVYQAAADGSKGPLVAFAQQKRLAFKEKVLFYTDENKTSVAFSFRAEKVLDIHGQYFVEDPAGTLIGAFRKDFSKSFVASTWYILDKTSNPQLTITESNQTLAILRRYAGFLPWIGDIVNIILNFFKYHFVFVDNAGQIVGTYQKTTLFRDHYLLSTDDTTNTQQDWRVLAAMAVALDALQSR